MYNDLQMKKILIAGIIILGIFTAWYYSRNPLGPKVVINDHVIPVEVAVTPQEKSKGLGERDSLAADIGMLFPYDRKDRWQFWMKGMRFALDFIWIDGTTVADITENVAAPSGEINLPVYQPKVPVDKVLEVNAGLVKKYGIQIGDTVKFTD